MFWVKEKVDGSIFPPFVAILCRMRHFFEIKICRIILLSLPFNATRSNLMPLILVETTNSVPWQLLILAFLKYFEFRVNYFNWNRIMEANHIFKHRQALIRVHRDTWKWSFSWKSRSSGFTTYTFLETKKFITLFLDYHQKHRLIVLLIYTEIDNTATFLLEKFSIPFTFSIFKSVAKLYAIKNGLNRDLNPGPLAPKARIIPLDHWALTAHLSVFYF